MFRINLTRSLVFSALLLAAPFVAAQADRQQAPTQPPQGKPGAAADQIDDATVDKFVDAFIEIQGIQQEFSKELQNVKDQEQARGLQSQAQEQMMTAVENNDLTVDEYNQVVAAINQDPEFRETIMQKASQQNQSN